MTDIMQKVAEVAPAHYQFLVKTANEVKESPFREEIVEELNGLIKAALDWGAIGSGLGGAGKAVGKGALALGGAAGVAAAGGIAIALAGDMYDAAKRGITKSRDYRNMMQSNPQLAQLPAKDVQRAFSTLHRLNPEFASDPNIAGAMVNNFANFGEAAYADASRLRTLVDSRKSLSEAKKISPFKMDKEPKPGRDGRHGQHGQHGQHGRMGPAGPPGASGPSGPMGPQSPRGDSADWDPDIERLANSLRIR